MTSYMGEALVAACIEDESVLRVWDLASAHNFILSMIDPVKGISLNEVITFVAFSEARQSLAATKTGKILIWKCINVFDKSQASWEMLEPIDVGAPIQQLIWGSENLLMAVLGDSIELYVDTSMEWAIATDSQLSLFQTAPDELRLEYFPTKKMGKFKSDVRIKQAKLFGHHLSIYDGQQVVLHRLDPDSDRSLQAEEVAAVSTHSPLVAVHDDRTLIMTEEGKVQLCNFKGVAKQSLHFSFTDGEPIIMDVCGNFLAVATTTNTLRLFDMERREVKKHGTTRTFDVQEFGKIISIRINRDGSHVSVLAATSNPEAPVRAFVYVVESNTTAVFNIDSATRFVVNHFWDPLYPKLLAYETTPTKRVVDNTSLSKGPDAAADDNSVNKVTLLFIVNEAEVGPGGGVMLHSDTVVSPKGATCLLGLRVPYLFFGVKNAEKQKKLHRNLGRGSDEETPEDDEEEEDNDEESSERSEPPASIVGVILRDFTGMENVESTIRDAILEFSYNLALGNMDAAYKAVKVVKNSNVWANMAQMMVKTHRVDMLGALAVCLGNMGNLRAAAALRRAAEDNVEPEARLAAVAVHLGMIDDAIDLYTQCGRNDMVNVLYQACGQWEKALNMTETLDRIHLKSTHYAYAKHLESLLDFAGAIQHYEKAETHRLEVPRMLFDAGKLMELDTYIQTSNDKKLFLWKAQYVESKGEPDEAMTYYEKAEDQLSLVRLYCAKENFAKARKIVDETGDPAACYHLARQYELSEEDKLKDALKLYIKAGCYNHAIRLAIEQEMEADVLHIALQATPEAMLLAAGYLEERQLFDKAVLLYQKGGNLAKAINLCFQAKLYEPLAMIAESVDSKADPSLAIKCAQFFFEKEQYAKAVQLYAAADHIFEALRICKDYKVSLTEEMGEKMSPPATEKPEVRQKVLRAIAHCYDKQRAYNLSCRKYTQAGDHKKAIEVLIKSDDTEKIVFFASVSQKPMVYIITANYLQKLEWRDKPDIIKNIILFYKKAQAWESLARFYQSCAQAEIDEFRRYDKAKGALAEAKACIMKMASAPERATLVKQVEQQVTLVDQYLQAHQLLQLEDPQQREQGARICNSILQMPQQQVEEAVRLGDVYSLAIFYYYQNGDAANAFELLEQMRKRKVPVDVYIEQEIVNEIYHAVHKEAHRGHHGDGEGEGEEQEEQQEQEGGDQIEERLQEGEEQRQQREEGGEEIAEDVREDQE
eukprot:TRINITY_DN1371_c0_g2_i2.p1 TRINITY_DN1371_c0_g2~~TRINITY_DN1371_c0_g2_i2.p1  ORF type:complete len:1217 (+),score=421.92 TRINITY_DN1371_c0_g2_i2:1075-4725(+)